MPAPTKEDTDLLEAIVDRLGLYGTLVALQLIAGEKATHIAEAWQDAASAKDWDRGASHLGQVAVRLKALGLTR